MALLRGFHDGSGSAHRKAEYTYATAPLPEMKPKRQQEGATINRRTI